MTYRKPRGAWTADLQWANEQDARIERCWSRVLGQDGMAPDEYSKVADGTAQQRSGCDRVAHFCVDPVTGGSTTVTLEEKVRRQSFEKYGDVLLEIKHVFDDGHEEPGWCGKWPSAEMFAWIWLGSGSDRCDWILALPTFMLKRHYETHIQPKLDRIPKRYWRRTRKNNVGYETWSLVLPPGKATPGLRPSRVNWPEEM